eukprot:SAG25_NODE_264_length_10707_cov_19.216043_13_plen_125_part_00
MFAMHCRYRNEWKEDEARKNIMRTHTTAISSRMLSRVAEELKQVTVCTAWQSLEAGPSIQGRFVAVCCRLEHFGLGNFSVWTESSATKPWTRHICASFTRCSGDGHGLAVVMHAAVREFSADHP